MVGGATKGTVTALNRRDFLKLLSAATCGTGLGHDALGFATEAALPKQPYQPGRITNEYSLFLPGEREALSSPPALTVLTAAYAEVKHGGKEQRIKPGENVDGWVLLHVGDMNGVVTAVFEKHVTHRGAIALVTERAGTIALVPKFIGDLSRIRPRETNTPHGVKLERQQNPVPGMDRTGRYILDSEEDPVYENIAALGEEYIGWSLVANEEAGPARSVYLAADGRSRQAKANQQAQWAPDLEGPLFNPEDFFPFAHPEKYVYKRGFSKRTLLGGFLPAANTGVWNDQHQCGYEVMMILPPGLDAQPIARMRVLIQGEDLERYEDRVAVIHGPEGRVYLEHYWNCSPGRFYGELAGLWNHWNSFYQDAMPVSIPDEWLLNAARAGITLTRCSYRGLEPTYQVGEGGYTKIPERSHALFPVAHYEFIWAHQLWNLTASSDKYFQHYLDHYILPDGNFVYNTQDQVEGPLNIGIVLMNSARSYFYTGDVEALAKRIPILERMLQYVLQRYEYGKQHYPWPDRRYGLIWGSPEADLGDPDNDYPSSHPFYYQNAACVWRGIEEHAKCLRKAAADSGNSNYAKTGEHYASLAQEMRVNIQRSIEATIAASNVDMQRSGITPFEPNDVVRKPVQLSNYENHRFMMDWFLADWGVLAYDAGHLKHREIAGLQLCGLNTDGYVPRTSNFMEHGTLAVKIRQDDYRPFLLTLYALVSYAADSGNCYAPEDAYIPGSYPGEQSTYGWSAVVNSTLQPTLGLRWLLCYEENDREVCHLQKAAPGHWFAKGERISVQRCQTRFGKISWLTEAVSDHSWKVVVDIEEGFSGDVHLHVHPVDKRPLEKASVGSIDAKGVLVLAKGLLVSMRHIEIELT